MPRRPRIVMEGLPFHVTQRGNYQQTVFSQVEDYQKYLYWAKEYALKYQVDILAYCLMSNHVHFVVIPQTKQGLGRFFNTLHMRYSQYKNATQNKTGHLWQGRFFSSLLNERHLLYAVRYVEQNPLRAGLVSEAKEYIWSSAKQRLDDREDAIIKLSKAEMIFDLIGGKNQWVEFMKQKEEKRDSHIRDNTRKGRATGGDSA